MSTAAEFWQELKRRRVVRALLSWAVFVFFVLQIADLTFEPLGIADWIHRALIAVAVAGFPVVAWLSWVFDLPDKPRRRLAIVLTALIAIGVTGAGYVMLTRAPPAGVTADVPFTTGGEILLMGMDNADQGLADTVSEALRVGLSSSPAFRLLEPAEVRRALLRMERDPAAPMDETVAREAALREGAEAYLTGTVGKLGSGFVLIARLVDVGDERTIANFRETARGEDDLIDGIDRLADRIRTGLGESLASVEAREPLSRVTTESLSALRSFAAGVRAYRNGQLSEAAVRYRAAIAEDPGFATAWSYLGPALQSSAPLEEWLEALRRSYELRERLPPQERLIIEVRYHDAISGDVEAEVYAMERLLELRPDDTQVTGQLGRAYAQHYADYDRAAELMHRAIEIDGEFASMSNMVWVQLLRGDLADAARVAEQFSQRYPETFWRHRGLFFVHYLRDEAEAAWQSADQWARDDTAPARWRSRARFYRSLADALAGRGAAALDGLRNSIANEAAAERWQLAVMRWSDLIWLQGVVLGDTAGAVAEARALLDSGWLAKAPNPGELYFRLVRDTARIGAADLAETLLARWQAEPPAFDEWSREEDLEAAGALIAGARGDHDAAIKGLETLMTRTEPRYTQREWPSAHHCQRCWRFDIGRLHAAAGNGDAAAAQFRRLLREADELVELPLNRVIARQWLAANEGVGAPRKDSLGD